MLRSVDRRAIYMTHRKLILAATAMAVICGMPVQGFAKKLTTAAAAQCTGDKMELWVEASTAILRSL
jgi:hypothetical protein